MRVRSKIAPGTANQVTQHVLQNFPTTSSTEQRGWAELLTGLPRAFAANAKIFGDGEPVNYLYKVAEGAVRTCKVVNDGRRQITGFYLSGEFFGIDIGDEHTFSAEAITNSKILIIKRSFLAVLAEHDIEVANRLLELTGCELERAQAHANLLIKSANERVAQFLLEMVSRKPKAMEIDLPMSRQDIADYLGLTIETVSRVLRDFEAAQVIARSTARHMVLRDRAKLSHTA